MSFLTAEQSFTEGGVYHDMDNPFLYVCKYAIGSLVKYLGIQSLMCFLCPIAFVSDTT